MLNGLTALAVNHLDTVGRMDKIKLCTAYKYKGMIVSNFSSNLEFLEQCEPVYEEFDGNFGNISDCKSFEDLPENAKVYINRIEEVTNTPVKFIGTGADRDNIIVRDDKVLKLRK